jgi:hypothetical protein
MGFHIALDTASWRRCATFPSEVHDTLVSVSDKRVPCAEFWALRRLRAPTSAPQTTLRSAGYRDRLFNPPNRHQSMIDAVDQQPLSATAQR